MVTMYPPQNNGVHTTLTAPINSAETSLQVAAGNVLPDAPTVLTLGTDEDAELVLVVSRTGNFLTVQRGYNGTTPKAWSVETWVYRAITAQDVQALQDNVRELDSGKQAVLNASNPLPITGGGTEGTTAAEARTNLGLRNGATTHNEYGSINVTVAANASVDTPVTFDTAFGASPRSIAGIATAGAARYVRLAAYASQSGGTIRAFNEMASGEITVSINWHAVGV